MSATVPTGVVRSTRRALLAPAAVAALGVPLLAAAPASAQSTPVPGSETPPPTIVVTGIGTVTATPDQATVSVGVSITGDDLTEAQAEATRVATGILDVARDNSIPEDDVQTVNYSVNVYDEYDDDGNRTGDRTFEVVNVFAVTFADLDATGAILAQLVDAGANTVYGISFGLADPTTATAQARTAAAEDARARAEAYAAGLGVEIGGVLSVYESSAPQPVAREVDYAADAAEQSVAAPVPVAAGTTEVTVQVEVAFLIAG
jgi:uncharacterized protein